MLLLIPVLKWVVGLEPDPLKSIIYFLNSFLVAPTVREAIKTSLPKGKLMKHKGKTCHDCISGISMVYRDINNKGLTQ